MLKLCSFVPCVLETLHVYNPASLLWTLCVMSVEVMTRNPSVSVLVEVLKVILSLSVGDQVMVGLGNPLAVHLSTSD